MIQNTINLAGSTPATPQVTPQVIPSSRAKGTRSGSVPGVAQVHVTSTIEAPARGAAHTVTIRERAFGILLVVVLPSAVWFGAIWAAARLIGYNPGAFGLTALATSLVSLLVVIYSSLNIDRS
jgi:hypothetical protein